MQRIVQLIRRQALIIVVGVLVGILLLWFFFLRGTGAINPDTDDLLNENDGKVYAALYKYNELFSAINENEDVLQSIKEDLLLFARTTRPEFKSSHTLVGFTVTNSGKEGSDFTYSGYFYGVKDVIGLKLTPHERGVYTLSITNRADGTNIDQFLHMNGPRNAYIRTLPIESDHYAIRYLLKEDRIVVSFYEGYTAKDVDEVEKSVTDGLGDAVNTDVTFTLNRFGSMSLSELRENLKNPIDLPLQ